jgi:hypothetical protein
MRWRLFILILALAAGGCVSSSRARLESQNAFLAGQNAALQRQAQSQTSAVTVLGAVRNSAVPWVEGLTLAQAVASADYIGATEPTQIILTHGGESAVLDAKTLLDGPAIPLLPGDVIELR